MNNFPTLMVVYLAIVTSTVIVAAPAQACTRNLGACTGVCAVNLGKCFKNCPPDTLVNLGTCGTPDAP